MSSFVSAFITPNNKAGKVILMPCGTMIDCRDNIGSDAGFYEMFQSIQREGGVECKVCKQLKVNHLVMFPHVHTE